MNTLQAALHWKEKSISCVPCYKNSKYLIRGTRISEVLDNPPTLPQYVMWFFNKRNNICLITDNDLTILDFDSLVAYVVWKSKYQLETYTVKTKRGFHAYFSIDKPVDIDKNSLPENVEIKCNGATALIPPSRLGDFQYHVVEDKEIKRVSTIQDVIECSVTPSKEKKPQLSSFTRCKSNASDPISRIKQSIPITYLFQDFYPFSSGMALAHCPTEAHKNGDKHPSLSLDLKSDRCQCFKPGCPLHGKRGNDILDAYSILNGLTLRQSIAELAEEIERNRFEK